MVNVMKGVLIECDPAMKQFLLHLDEKVSINKIVGTNEQLILTLIFYKVPTKSFYQQKLLLKF